MKTKQILNNWEEIEIEKFTQVITGGTPLTSKKEYWENGTIPWLPSGDLKNKPIKIAHEFITEEGLKNSSAKIMPKDTVLIALTGATTGQTAILEIEASANQSVTGIIPSKTHYPKYLLYFLQTIRKKVKSQSYGGAQPHISQGYVKKIKIPIPFKDGKPDLKEQERIVKILERAEKNKEITEISENLLDEYLKSLFYELFYNKKYENKKLKSLIAETDTISYGIVQPGDEFKDGAPVIRPVDIVDGYLILDKIKKVNPEIPKKFKRTNLIGGEVLITVRGTTGDVVIAPKSCYGYNVTRGIAVIRPIGINSYYLKYYLLLMGAKYIQTNTKGATLKQINLSDLDKMNILFPPLPLQEKFAKIVMHIEGLKENIRKSKQNSEELFNSLMDKAFRGEL